MGQGKQLLVVVMVAFAVLSAHAQTHIGGVMRDEYALGLTPPLKSAGMGGAYVGVEGTQSMNPAGLSSVDFREVYLTYGIYDHDEGPLASRIRGDLTAPVPILGGAARIMLDGVVSDGSDPTAIAGNPELEFDAFTLGLQYGRNITDWWAVGFGGYPYEKANVDMITPGGTFEGEAFSQIGSIQLGTLFRPHEKVTIGGQFIYIKDDLEVSLPGPGSQGDYFNIHYYALGAAVTPFDGTLVAVDYWNGEVEGEFAPHVQLDSDIDRWNFGIQQRCCEYFDVRAGSNNGGFTAGFSLHPMENLDIDYAYINEALRDKESIFDETQFHGIALTYRF